MEIQRMNSPHEHLAIYLNSDRRTSYIEDIIIPNEWELTEGVPIKHSVPESTTFKLSPKRGDMLCDFVPNLSRVLILSEPAIRLLQAEGLTGDELIEYLPIILLDKRGRPTRTRYYLVNPLLKVDCMDVEASEVLRATATGEILHVERLKIHEDKVPPDAKLFRLGECTEVILIRSDLLQRIQEAGLTGLVVKAQGEDIY
jgi:hypothetical protein